jgi:ABC-type sugar transport system, permease component
VRPHIGYRIAAHAVLIAGSAVMLFPFLWTVSTSLKDISEVFTYPPRLSGKEWVWENYVKVWERYPFLDFFLNTVKITALVVIGQLLTSSMAGYVFARLKFRGRDAIFMLYLATIIIPVQVTVIPNFFLMKTYGLIDTHWSLILPGFVSAFGTFLLRQFFQTIPAALEEAAKIDGCNPFGIYWRIFVPLSKPAMATLGIFICNGVWNDFYNPLIFINTTSKMTLTLGLATMQGLYSTDWPVLMAATTISITPIIVLFLLAQDLFVRGVTLSGLKGE